MPTPISRLSLGTVQFGLEYGIANATGKVGESEVADILQTAWNQGIEALDTASSYGDSETVLGHFLKAHPTDFKIVTKLAPMDDYRGGLAAESLHRSFKQLNVPAVHGYLLHRFSDYLSYSGLWPEMQEIKKQGLVRKIGFSLYSPEELELLFSRKENFDVVQFPYSVFDRRFESYFSPLKEKGIEVQVRSVFLQGLAFMRQENLSPFFAEAKGPIDELRKISTEMEMSLTEICLNFVLAHPQIDRVVIGVDGLKQFQENVNAARKFVRSQELLDRLQNVRIDNENILLPFRWKKEEDYVKS